MTIPGVYEIVSEHFNNEVIERWERQQRLTTTLPVESAEE